jgi:soluble lytic murein transglycosylase-like protein
MPAFARRSALVLVAAALAACGSSPEPAARLAHDTVAPASNLHALADAVADRYGVPRDLVHRLIRRESGYNPAARNGPYIGLMQIHPQTARTMGFRGSPEELFDPETNLTYAVRYLRGAWIVADGDRDRAVMWYARGYYFEARDRGLLEVTGLRPPRSD